VNKQKKINDWSVALLLIFIFFLYSYNLTGWLIHDDEGGYLYQAWRMTEGYAPYRDFYTPKEPLFLFTGSFIFKLFGLDIFWVRMFSVVLTILTGYLIFLIGRRVYSNVIAFSAALLYLTLPIVYSQARLFRSDSHVVFFSTLGLFLFLKGWQDKTRPFFLYSGIFYAIALGYKLAAILGMSALVFFLVYEAAMRKEKRISTFLYFFIPFVSGFLVTSGIILIIVLNLSPSFLNCLINHQLGQPLLSSVHMFSTLRNNARDFFMLNSCQYDLPDTQSWLIIWSLPVIVYYLFTSKETRKILSFYIFGVVVLLFSPYPGEIFRYLLYFLPVAVLVFTSIIFYLLGRKRNVIVRILGLAVLLFILIKMLTSAFMKDKAIFNAKENGTLAFAGYIKNHTAEDDYVVADYGDVLFHAKRKTTPLMAGMSKSTVDNGVITSDKLISELEKYHVKMVLIHKEGGIDKKLGFYLGILPHHFSTLINSKDGSRFLSYLQSQYQLVADYNRSGQIFSVYVRK
jgi:4-amino-4-deoxy-L-arabinose transferase-like glycosyltransferase